MALYRSVDLFFELLYLLILVRVLLSWTRPDPYNSFIRIIYQITDPILEPFKRLIYQLIPQSYNLRIDFSPIVAIFVLNIVQKMLLRLLIILRL